jgi:hypothetical protein
MQSHRNEASNAQIAHQSSMTRIHELLTRLQVGVDAKLIPTSETLHWGHAGDAKRIEVALQELCDRVFHEGEYA